MAGHTMTAATPVRSKTVRSKTVRSTKANRILITRRQIRGKSTKPAAYSHLQPDLQRWTLQAQPVAPLIVPAVPPVPLKLPLKPAARQVPPVHSNLQYQTVPAGSRRVTGLPPERPGTPRGNQMMVRDFHPATKKHNRNLHNHRMQNNR